MNEQLELNIPNFTTVVTLQETTVGSYCYIAFHPELPNILSQGDTVQEAEANLVEATELAIEHLVRHGLPVPEPETLGQSGRSLPDTGTSRIFRNVDSSVSVQPMVCSV